jgi:hypothetical protein
LKYFENESTLKDSDYKKFVFTILKQENENRLTILERIVATNENFYDKDLPKVQKISASLNRDNAHARKKFNQTTELGQQSVIVRLSDKAFCFLQVA